MSEERDRAPTALDYDKPPAKASPVHRRFRIFIAVVAVYAFLLALVPFGYEQPFFVALAVGAIGGVLALVISRFLAIVRKPRVTEEEFEAEWNSRQELKSNMVELAQQVYQQAPLGKWQKRVVTFLQRGWPKVHEEKLLELIDGGNGLYRWVQHDLSMKCETTFKYKPGENGTILVLQTSPPSKEWLPVAFGFDMGKNEVGEEELRLWMEGENPFADNLAMHWPFDDTFVRAA